MTKRALLVVVFVIAAACGRAPNGTVRIDMDEFKVIPKPWSVDAGLVRFEEKNVGAISHELVVIRTDLPARELPLLGAEVDLTAKTVRVAVRDRRLAAGKKRTLRVRLDAGKYVLICNVPGHYQSGMRTRFVVG